MRKRIYPRGTYGDRDHCDELKKTKTQDLTSAGTAEDHEHAGPHLSSSVLSFYTREGMIAGQMPFEVGGNGNNDLECPWIRTSTNSCLWMNFAQKSPLNWYAGAEFLAV